MAATPGCVLTLLEGPLPFHGRVCAASGAKGIPVGEDGVGRCVDS